MTKWTEDELADLEKLWNSGRSSYEISRALCRSRNSIIGALHRRKLLGAARLFVPKGGRKPKPPAAPVEPPPVSSFRLPERCSPVSPAAMAVFSHGRDQCRWPIGETGGRPFRFCGAPAPEGKPYCEAHAAKARPRHEGRPGGHPIKRTGVRPHAISSGLVDA